MKSSCIVSVEDKKTKLLNSKVKIYTYSMFIYSISSEITISDIILAMLNTKVI